MAINKKIRLDHDGGITILYGEQEKFGRCIHNGKEFCGVWCPLFPVPVPYVTDTTHHLLSFKCHGGMPVEVEVKK